MTEPQWRRFAQLAAERHGAPEGDSYPGLWQWSVQEPAGFWRAVWEFFDIRAAHAPAPGDAGVLAEATMPGARWFPGVTLNYVDQVLRHSQRRGRP